jgi:hypothetical protein
MRRSVNKFDVEKARNEWATIHRARSLVKCLEDEVLSEDPILLVRLIQEISYHCKIGWAYLSQCLGQPARGLNSVTRANAIACLIGARLWRVRIPRGEPVLIRYSGYLGEWELTATVMETAGRKGLFLW